MEIIIDLFGILEMILSFFKKKKKKGVQGKKLKNTNNCYRALIIYILKKLNHNHNPSPCITKFRALKLLV